MAVERLRWLVWLCNFAGVLPVHMLFKAGRFRRFQIRCNHPLGLWFCTVQLFQLFFVATFSYLAFQFQIATDSRLPFVNKLAGGMLQVSSMVTFISPQLILFHLKRLETAVKLLQQADQILDGIRPPCSTRLRTAIGLLVTLAWVRTTLWMAVMFCSHSRFFRPQVDRDDCFKSAALRDSMAQIHRSYHDGIKHCGFCVHRHQSRGVVHCRPCRLLQHRTSHFRRLSIHLRSTD